MPLIRCPRCGQAYEIPGAVAVRLPNAIATCHCGEWLAGSKAAVLARLLNPDELREIDLQPYRVESAGQSESAGAEPEPLQVAASPRSIRVIARGGDRSIDTVFTIHEHPLWIGSRASHVELPQAELSIRHCSISLRGSQLVIRDADSHMGTFLDGKVIDEAVIDDGIHLLRLGSALVSVEPTAAAGIPVEPLAQTDDVIDESTLLRAMRSRARSTSPEATRPTLVCVEGLLAGQEFEIPATGLIVGREGHVRVPDEYLSRRHFEVFAESDGTIRVRDLGSRNGTFLNTLPARNTKVQGGDEIVAGVNRFRIERR